MVKKINSSKQKEIVTHRKRAPFKVFDVVNYTFLTLLTLVFILPFWSTIVTSFVSEAERLARGMFIFYPQNIDLGAYTAVLKPGSQVYSGYIITIIRTFGGTTCNMLVTVTLAYGMSKKGLPGRTIITFLIYFTMLFSGGLVPTYLVVRHTGLYNNIGAYIVPGLVSVWNLFLMRNFFMQIPESLEEAAIIDGASPLTVLLRVVLPLSLSSLVTIALFYAVGHWNSWFDGLIYVQKIELLPLQNILRNIIIASNVENVVDHFSAAPPPLESIKGATIVVSTLPILLIYPFAQKYFIKGVMVGGIKG